MLKAADATPSMSAAPSDTLPQEDAAATITASRQRHTAEGCCRRYCRHAAVAEIRHEGHELKATIQAQERQRLPHNIKCWPQ